MAITANILHTGQFEHHLLTRKQKVGRFKKTLIVGLMLTSLVDMFSMLVCFLLQTFSSSPEIFIAKDVKLAEAFSGGEVKVAPVLSVSKTSLYLDQKVVGDLQVLLKSPTPLVKGLESLRQKWSKENPGKAYPGEINLQADKDMASTDVAKLMGILNSQRFEVIQLAVMGAQ
ncbi:MAG: biopolymer transporter ExbD [Bacteriovoracaceae bacterium]|nr:biopolymer transporter ExbD [Bacteriovoracaceae bacterium]